MLIRFELHKIQDPEASINKKIAREDSTIKDYLSCSEHILSSTSEYFGSTIRTIRADQSITQFGRDEAARIREWIIEEDDADDPTRSSEDDVEVVMTSEYAVVAKE
jgi:hypothetical protein